MDFGFGLPETALALGIGKDVFGGISAYEQARRQQQQYNYAKQFQNPQWVTAQSQPYIAQQQAALQQELPALMRQTVNPMLGSQGIDPTSGAGQSIYANATAPLALQATQQGIQNFLGASGQGQQYGTQNVGQMYGGMNGTQDALYLMMLQQYLNKNQNAQNTNIQQGMTGTGGMTPYTGATGLEGLSQYANVPMADSMAGGYPIETIGGG